MKTATKATGQRVVTLLGLTLLLAMLPANAWGQPYISTRGGLVNVIDGQADMHNGRDMKWQKARPLLQLRSGDELRSRENSRVELLLNPGSFARLGPDSTVRLVNDRLTELSLGLLDGSMEVEAGNLKIIGQMTVSVLGHQFMIVKDGIYRFDVNGSESATARVYRGEMRTITANGKTTRMKKSSEATIQGTSATMALGHFDTRQIDSLSEWAAFRAGELARANRGVIQGYSQGYFAGPYSYYGYGFNPFLWGGGWFYDPFYGFYTFLPGYGNYYSPYGGYYTPIIVVTNGGQRAGSIRNGPSGNRESITPSGGFGSKGPSFSGPTVMSPPMSTPRAEPGRHP